MNEHDLFVDHCVLILLSCHHNATPHSISEGQQAYVLVSSPGISTGIYLQSKISEKYSPEQCTVTQDVNFDLDRFAQSANGDVQIDLVEDLSKITRLVFEAPKKRCDGKGTVTEIIVLAKFRVRRREHTLTAVKATWTDPRYGSVTQWHLLGPPEVAAAIIHDCCKWASLIRGAVLVFDRGCWRQDSQLWKAVQNASWEDVILDEALKRTIRLDYQSFFRSEETYRSLQVPWKRGLILMGPPGNGKTITLKAIMKEVEVPSLYVKSFKNPNGDEFGIRQIFSRARSEAPCVLVLEDLDSLVKEENRSFFLNEVDGLEDNDGLLLIGTTNHFEKLDPALTARPSRFDRKYMFAPPSKLERDRYIRFWSSKLATNGKLGFNAEMCERISFDSEGLSFAYLKEVFVSALLTLASEPDSGDTHHDRFQSAVLHQVEYLQSELQAGREAGMASSWNQSLVVGPDDRSGVGVSYRVSRNIFGQI